MLKTALQYGFLATVLLLVLVVGEYALFLKPTVSSWVIGGGAAVVLGVGLWLGSRLLGRAQPDAGHADRDGGAATVLQNMPEKLERLGISEREYEVLGLVAAGLSNQEIADRLFIAETTVKSHVSSLLAKLDARRRTEAVSRAQEEGIL